MMRTPPSSGSVVHGRPVRSFAANREPACGGNRAHCNGTCADFSTWRRHSNYADAILTVAQLLASASYPQFKNKLVAPPPLLADGRLHKLGKVCVGAAEILRPLFGGEIHLVCGHNRPVANAGAHDYRAAAYGNCDQRRVGDEIIDASDLIVRSRNIQAWTHLGTRRMAVSFR